MISPPDTTGAPKLEAKSDAAAATAKRIRPARPKDSPEELHRACSEFEEIFVRMILKEAHLDRALYGEEDSGAKLYGDLLIETLAKSVAQGGGLGIGDMLYREFAADESKLTVDPKSADRR
jgi:flagellar protein FlgJ